MFSNFIMVSITCIYIIHKENETIKFHITSNIVTILHNSDLNTDHKSPFFIECSKIIEREEKLTELLK